MESAVVGKVAAILPEEVMLLKNRRRTFRPTV